MEAKVQKRRKLMAISYKKGPTGTGSTTSTSKAASMIRSKVAANEPTIPARYFLCMHTKRSNKKHKVYEDGVISVEGNIVKLFDMDAKMIGKTNTYSVHNLSDLHPGNELYVGSKELEVSNPVEPEKFISGQVFRNANTPLVLANPMVKPKVKEFKNHKDAKNLDVERKEIVLAPRYDPNAPGALVLQRNSTVPVVVDPHLSRTLRPHQKDGIQFMYDCIMGIKGFEGISAFVQVIY